MWTSNDQKAHQRRLVDWVTSAPDHELWDALTVANEGSDRFVLIENEISRRQRLLSVEQLAANIHHAQSLTDIEIDAALLSTADEALLEALECEQYERRLVARRGW